MDATAYRAKAAEMRKRLQQARDPIVREELEKLAAEYDRLAEAAQRRTRPKPGGS